MPTFRGFPACQCLVEWLPAYEAELLRRKVIKYNIDIAQLIGGYAKSGGTHATGGAFDIWQTGSVVETVAREMGAATWTRTRAQGFDPHAHGVLNGCPHNGPARYQIGALADGRNGLADGGRDDGDGPRNLRTWQQGIVWAKAQATPAPVVTPEAGKWVVGATPFLWGLAKPGTGNEKKSQAAEGTTLTTTGYVMVGGVRWYQAVDKFFYSGEYLIKPGPVVPATPLRVRVMTYNPSDKMGNTAARAALVAEYVRKGDPDVVAFQELTGRQGDGKPSPWAYLVAKALGTSWKLLTPTTAWNENYIAYRVDRLTAKQLPDHVMRVAGAEGKHCSLAVLTQISSGRSFALGDTHLDPYASVAARARQCVDANRATKSVADQHGRIPYILAGDFNYEYLFPEMKNLHRWDVGHRAAIRRGWKFSTFIGKTPTLDVGPHIDYITVGEDATVVEATVVQVLDSTSKKYKMPLAGDHVPKLAVIEWKN